MTKMDDGLPIVGPTVDMAQAPAINQKRTLAFINHFITHTVRFLNKFSGACEEKLADIQLRIQRLEITLSILEAKLSSIPGLENVTAGDVTTNEQTSTTTEIAADNQPKPETAKVEASTESVVAEEIVSAPTMTVSNDPRYTKYFKMLKMGVPAQGVKVKMAAEGLNPDLLDTPDAPAPSGGEISDDSDGGSSSDASSFSDSD